MADKNAQGERGESIFKTRITQGDLFAIYFLGEKAPIVDFLLEINDKDTPYPFMVQVKSITTGFNGEGKLKVRVSKKKYKALSDRPLPTYIAGVDINNETVYICSAFSDKKNLKSMDTKFRLKFSSPVRTKRVLERLKQDVIDYWNNSNISTYKKSFKSSL